jgi:hypothetical protein
MRFDANVPILENNTWPFTYPIYKFNVEIKNYQWQSMSDDALLVFSYTLEKLQLNNQTGAWEPTPVSLSMYEKRTVNFDEAYFSINSSADVGTTGDQMEVEIMLASTAIANSTANNSDVYIVYKNFNGYLMHDPEVGFGKGPGFHTLLIFFGVLVVAGVVSVLIISIGALIVITRRKKRRFVDNL